MTLRAKHSNPWRSSTRGTQAGMLSDQEAATPSCSVFPSLLPDWDLPRENHRCSAQYPGTRHHNKQLSSAVMAKLRPTANSNRSWKVSVSIPFCEKPFELYSEIKGAYMQQVGGNFTIIHFFIDGL